MSKTYWIEGDRVKEKDGSNTSNFVDSGAVHVSSGSYNGQEAIVVVYSDGKVKMTIGSKTSDVRCGLSGKIVSTNFHDKGMVLTDNKGERYYLHPGGGSKF
jgi:hypothetical protein